MSLQVCVCVRAFTQPEGAFGLGNHKEQVVVSCAVNDNFHQHVKMLFEILN